ncbi:ABC transporter substrate-binding protein [Saccharothrix longispora]|uniref:Multiple sugar transport system substrate-binding protein n=1 Tax=Saccharothrix longispora TaxID=33920 RepID=A0ABU1PTI5_9PSEU|nr:extracellular solute-binding protein [Saccharothrix longispora]MDR6593958.1 multiple sugar transport system substrate-binding protein [Saccharothrix longispora]
MGALERLRRTAASALVLAAVLTGCGDDAGSGPVTLRYAWWGNAERAELMQRAIDLFHQRNPDIRITPSFQEFEAYWQKMATETAGGNAPDVLQMDFAYLREYADRGALHDLSGQEGNLELDDLLDGLRTAGEVDGRRYGVPVGGNTWGYLYNPALYAQAGVAEPAPGWTWDDYRAALRRITERTGVHGGGNYIGSYYNLELQLRQEGGQLYTADGKLGFDKARLAEFLREGTELADAGAVLPVEKGVQIKPSHALELDLVAGDLGWDNFTARYAKTAKAELKLGPVPGGGGQYLKPAMLLSLSGRTEHPEAAAKLVSFMVNDPEVGRIFGANRGLPPTNAQRAAVRLEGPLAAVAAYEDELKDEFGETPPAPPKGAGTLEQAFIRITEELQYDRITVDEAVDRFFTEADETLEP